jgi:UDP-GlcNAc3NAcA epimerase
VTDSGGVQKEAFFMGKVCVIMCDQTEWLELIEAGANELVGTDKDKIIDAIKCNLGREVKDENKLYGGGVASIMLAKILSKAI